MGRRAEWTERIPNARMISEDEGESPLAWQGGKLSREIAAFCEEPAVAERLDAADEAERRYASLRLLGEIWLRARRARFSLR